MRSDARRPDATFRPLWSAPTPGVLVVVLASLLSSCVDRWDRSFDPYAEGPHGLSMMPALLRAQWPGARYVALESKALADLPDDPQPGDIYIAIGEGLPYDSLQRGRLLSFVDKGGTALLASEELSIAVPRALVKGQCLGERYQLYYPYDVFRGDTAVDTRGGRAVLDPVTRRKGTTESVTTVGLANFCLDQANTLIEVLYHADTSAYMQDVVSDADVTDVTEPGEGNYDDGDYEDQANAQDPTQVPPVIGDDGSDEFGGYTEAPPGAGGEYPTDERYPADDYEDDGDYLDGGDYGDDAGYEGDDLYQGEPDRYYLMTEVPYGGGHVLFYSAPIMLTNAYIADSIGRPHITQVLSYLPREATTVYFDITRRASAREVAHDNMPPQEDYERQAPPRQNILREVFKRPALAAAWYMTIAAVLAFALFGVKRLQRVVPVINPRRNTTLAYLGGVSRLYLARPDNRLMAKKQLGLFEAYCVRKFGLRPVRNPDDRRRLGELQGVDDEKVEALLRYQTAVERGHVLSNDAFVRLVHILRSLYQQLGRRAVDSSKTSV